MILKCLRFGDSKKEKNYPTAIQELCHQFSYEDLGKSTNNFDHKPVIGWVAFGKLYKGFLKKNHAAADHSIITFKVLSKYSTQGSLEFKNEIEILCQLHHPNIISLIGFCNQEKGKKIVVYEYMANGSLSNYLSDRNKETLSWNKRLDICIGVARALHYLHAGAKRCIVHRDINPSNILLDKNMMPKLANFGISLHGAISTLKPSKIIVDRVVSTSSSLAPEYLAGIVTDKCDVFNFGMILQHMLCNNVKQYLIQNRDEVEEYVTTLEKIMDPVLKGKIAPECWQVFTSVTQSCLKIEAEERPSMGEVEILLEHALSLQQQADTITNNAAHCYTLSSATPLFV